MQIHMLCMPSMDQMSTPMVSYVTGGHRTVIRKIRDMEGTSTSSTITVECIIFYVDLKSVGSDSDAECPIADNDEEDSLDDLVFLWAVTMQSRQMVRVVHQE